VGGFIAAAIGEGFGLSSWPARAAIFLGFAVVTYFSIVVETPPGEGEPIKVVAYLMVAAAISDRRYPRAATPS